MTDQIIQSAHWRGLESLYLAGPINDFYPPEISVEEERATISIAVDPRHFHTMGSLHGSVYFKLLDDSAVFAASSINYTHTLFTATFTTKIRVPVSNGRLTAVGKVTEVRGKKIFAESEVFDDAGQRVASGHGLFMPSPVCLQDVAAYRV